MNLINKNHRFSPKAEITIPDANLKAELKKIFNLGNTDPITPELMATLTTLDVSNKSIGNITGLEYARNLTSLDISDNKISDVQPLTILNQFTELNASNNLISDLTQVGKIIPLEIINLNSNGISDLGPLSTLINLHTLRVSSNQITRYELELDLVILECNNNKINFFYGGGLVNIEELYCNDNQISLDGLLSPSCPLRILECKNNNITNSITLVSFEHIERIIASNNQIPVFIIPFAITTLKYFDVSDNQISSFNVVKNDLPALLSLNLSNNKLTDIAPLADLTTTLTDLNLGSNQISDISPLANLTSLIDLNLEKNTITSLAPLKNINLQISGFSNQVVQLPNVEQGNSTELELDDSKGLPVNITWTQSGSYENSQLTWDNSGINILQWTSDSDDFSGSLVQIVE